VIHHPVKASLVTGVLSLHSDRTVEEVIVLADTLIKDRGKWIAEAILENWKRSLNI